MKNTLKIGLLLLLVCGFGACEKENTATYGHAEIVFLNDRKPESVTIYTEVGNKLYTREVQSGAIGFDLNAGNYKVQPYGQAGLPYVECYFQIIAGRTTTIWYSNNSGEVRID